MLRLCARTYPRADRAAVLSLSEELVHGGASTRREAIGLLRGGLEARLRLTDAPWREALDQLGLPLAGLLLAAMLLGAGQYAYAGLAWFGWSWAAGLAGAIAAVLGLGIGRRSVALPGVALVAALCLVDGGRDLYGSGSRWTALWVDVLPALLPAALVLLVAAAQPRRRDIRAMAWTLTAAVALALAGLAIGRNTTSGTTVLVAGLGLVLAVLLRAVRRSSPSPAGLAGALALAAAAPAGVWCLVGAAPMAESDSLAELLLVALAIVAVVAVIGLARSATTAARTPDEREEHT
jgi:hypothetical protein